MDMELVELQKMIFSALGVVSLFAILYTLMGIAGELRRANTLKEAELKAAGVEIPD